MKKLYLLILICLPGLCQAQQVSPEKETLVKKLITVTKAVELAKVSMNGMIERMKQNPAANVPDGFWDEFQKEVTDDELYRLYTPIYAKHYTEQELQQLIDFYDTPVGKKTILTMPQVIQESMMAGEEWGKQIGLRVYERLKK